MRRREFIIGGGLTGATLARPLVARAVPEQLIALADEVIE